MRAGEQSAEGEVARFPIGTRLLLLAAFAVAVVLCAEPSMGQSGPEHWSTYSNDRYGTTIDYPDRFVAQPPPDADDGLKFKSNDGAEFSIFAFYNTLDFDVPGFEVFTVEHLDAGSVITYRASGSTWFVLSGTRGNDIFYERQMLSYRKEMAEGFVIVYPAKLKAIYAPIVARMAKSFRSGKGFQSP